MKKILIVYATAGIGHKKAAVAVKKALDELNLKGDMSVTLIDALDYTPPFFKWTYLKLYLLAVNKLSLLWGFMYYLTDNFYVNIIVWRLRRFNNWLNSKRFVGYLLSSQPEVIISTHFFASEVASDLKRKGILRSHVVTVITDYKLHSWWVSDFVDTYVVSNKAVADDLARWGIIPSRIKVIGIPVEPVFSIMMDKAALQDKFALTKGLFTILVIGGGFGVGPIEKIVKTVSAINLEAQLIVVCGHNEELIKKMEAFRSNMKAPMKVLGFVDYVYELMEVSDILISKSGGVTVTESMVKELPMVVIAPIPGQETGNSSFLVEHKAAVQIDRIEDLKDVIEDLISNPEKINRMKESIRSIRMPTSSYDIAKMAIELA